MVRTGVDTRAQEGTFCEGRAAEAVREVAYFLGNKQEATPGENANMGHVESEYES